MELSRRAGKLLGASNIVARSHAISWLCSLFQSSELCTHVSSPVECSGTYLGLWGRSSCSGAYGGQQSGGKNAVGGEGVRTQDLHDDRLWLFLLLHFVTSLVSLTKSSANLTSKQNICLKEVNYLWVNPGNFQMWKFKTFDSRARFRAHLRPNQTKNTEYKVFTKYLPFRIERQTKF